MARRGTPSLGAVASSPRGAADGWRDRVDARAAAEMPSGYEVYDRCLPFKEVPTRTRHLQVHLFENRPNFPRERILEADSAIREARRERLARQRARDAARLRREARFREDAERLRALALRKDAPTRVAELVRPHASDRHGEVVDNSGAYHKTGLRPKHLLPTPKSRVPGKQGRVVPVRFRVKVPGEWGYDHGDDESQSDPRGGGANLSDAAEAHGLLAVGEQGPAMPPNHPSNAPSPSPAPSRSRERDEKQPRSPPERLLFPARPRSRPASAASSFRSGYVEAHRPPAALSAAAAVRFSETTTRAATTKNTTARRPRSAAPGAAPLLFSDDRPLEPARSRETPLTRRAAAILDRPASPKTFDTSAGPVPGRDALAEATAALMRDARAASARARRVLRDGSSATSRSPNLGTRTGPEFDPKKKKRPEESTTPTSSASSVGFDPAHARVSDPKPERVAVSARVAAMHASDASVRKAPRATTRKTAREKLVASKATFGYAFPAGPAAAHFAARTGTLEERRRVVAARRVSGAIARGLGGRENVVAGAAGVREGGGGGGRREGGGVCVVEANRAHHGLEGVSGSKVFEKVSDEVSNATPRGRSKKVVIRPASAFRGDEGRFVGDKSRTDIEGDGGAAAFVFGGG
jgi:hypothetical protein